MQQISALKDNLRLLVTFAAIFFVIHGSWLFNFSGTVDDVMLGDTDWIILTRGKWVAWLFKTAFSHGPNYPYGGIFCGLAMAAAALLQCRALGLKQTWQQVAYAVLLFSSCQEIDNMSWWMQSDTCAVGILAASAAACMLARGEGRKWLYAVPLLAVSMGCYQTLGTYFFVLFLCVLLLHFVQGRRDEALLFAKRGAVAMVAALALYFAASKGLALLAPDSYVEEAANYQGKLLGWEAFFAADTTGRFWMAVNYGVSQPLLRFLTLRGGHWLYLSALLPAVCLAVHFAWNRRFAHAAALAAGGAVILYIPFLFAPLLMHHTGFEDRVMNAVPVSTACLWGMAFILLEGHFLRHARAYGSILVLAGVQALYLSGAAARDRMYSYERATDELKNMHMLARVEARMHGLNDCDIVFCGIIPERDRAQGKTAFLCSMDPQGEDAAMQDIFQRWLGTKNNFFKTYAKFFRIGKRMRYAQADELRLHSAKLRQMPIWPADGSVAADGDVVLIKLGDEMEPGVPLPAPSPEE